jgi:hypothetical protein
VQVCLVLAHQRSDGTLIAIRSLGHSGLDLLTLSFSYSDHGAGLSGVEHRSQTKLFESNDRLGNVSAACTRAARLDPHPADEAGECSTTRGHQHYRAQRTLEGGHCFGVGVRLSGHHGV